MRKDSRLSFRISPELNKRINLALYSSNDAIRDKSEFGTKAIKFYLDHLQISETEQNKIAAAVMAIAEYTNIKTPEITILKNLFKTEELRLKESHPEFEEILILQEKFSAKVQNEISNKLNKAEYNDIEEIYEHYRQKYYLEGFQRKNKIIEAKTKTN